MNIMNDMYAPHGTYMNGYQQQYYVDGTCGASFLQAPVAYNQTTNYC